MSSPRDFLHSRENYERWRNMPYDQARMGLDRMRRLLAELGNPDQHLPAIHVAGTKGKGSTAATIAAVLSAAGYRTGLFTSPHLLRIEERIQIDGQCIAADDFDALIELVRPAVERMDAQDAGPAAQRTRQSGALHRDPCPLPLSPTYFEIVTAMAFLHFARQNVRTAVLEVGLGGRLDATNVCRPAVSVITSISLDHTQQLGDTLAAIAGEKAGIVRSDVPVVSGVIEPEPQDVIRRVCRERGAPLIERGTDFDFDYEPPTHLERAAAPGRLKWWWMRAQEREKEGEPGGQRERFRADSPPFLPFSPFSSPLSLPGRHQAANAATALAAIEVLRQKGGITPWCAAPGGSSRQMSEVPDSAIRAALSGMTWPARVEVISRRPAVVLDAAHNVASIEALLVTLRESFAADRRLLIFGTTHDKDVRGMLAELLGEFDEIYFTRYRGSSRAVPPQELQRLAEELSGRLWPTFDDSAAAWSAARSSAAADDLICITGSFYLAAELKERM